MLFEAGSACGQAGCVAVPAKERQDRFGMVCKMGQGTLHRRDDFRKLLKVLVVRGAFLGVAPQIFYKTNRMLRKQEVKENDSCG